MKICRVCDTEFTPRNGQKQTCSPECLKIVDNAGQDIEKARRVYQAKMNREFMWQRFVLGTRIVFR